MGCSIGVKPLGAKLLVRPEEKTEKVEGGIVIPGKAGARGNNRTAYVLDVGPKYKGDLSEGSQIIISPFCGTEIKIGKELYLFITEADVLAEIED